MTNNNDDPSRPWCISNPFPLLCLRLAHEHISSPLRPSARPLIVTVTPLFKRMHTANWYSARYDSFVQLPPPLTVNFWCFASERNYNGAKGRRKKKSLSTLYFQQHSRLLAGKKKKKKKKRRRDQINALTPRDQTNDAPPCRLKGCTGTVQLKSLKRKVHRRVKIWRSTCSRCSLCQ